MNQINFKSEKGFTLIEMLVVVAIVGLLAGVVVVGLSGSRAEARDARRISDIKSMQNQLELDYSSENGYPPLTSNSGPEVDTYLNSPDDDTAPRGPQGNPYQYTTTNGGFGYELGIELESSDRANDDTSNCSNLSLEAPSYCVTPQ